VVKSTKKYLLLGLLPLVGIILAINEYLSLGKPDINPYIAIVLPDIDITLVLDCAEDFTKIQFVNPSKPPSVEGFRYVYVTLHGEGTVVYKNFYIQYDDKRIQINGRNIKEIYGDAPRYIITAEGKIIQGVIPEPHWRR